MKSVDQMRRELASEPQFLKMVDKCVEDKVSQAILHTDGYRTDEELNLLGLMVKYATVRGLTVTVVPNESDKL